MSDDTHARRSVTSENVGSRSPCSAPRDGWLRSNDESERRPAAFPGPKITTEEPDIEHAARETASSKRMNA
jgi:hypothetical protein